MRVVRRIKVAGSTRIRGVALKTNMNSTLCKVTRWYDERLQKMEIEWAKPPTTQLWGNRSTYFRDPDGNLMNFYTRVSNT